MTFVIYGALSCLLVICNFEPLNLGPTLSSAANAVTAPAAIDNMITNHGKGNPELVNLPRKINIGLATTRDDFAHTHINDVGLYAAKDPETGKVLLLWL